SAVGISVLAMKGYLCSKENEEMDLRLDSCADISLISEECYLSLKNRPKLQQGHKMRLWQVTDKNCSLKGYVHLPVFTKTKEGKIIETEVEAYILPGMTVPILLGEDYQLTYEVAVTRSVEKGSSVWFEEGRFEVGARPVERTKDTQRIQESAKKAQSLRAAKEVRIAHDVRIKAGEVKMVELHGHFTEEKEWLIERDLTANPNDSVVPIPNVLFSSLDPRIPLANPGTRP
ncbi:hypothetical protein CPC08DRAFT_612944, partial [Agrocybe pediades]